MKAFLGTIVHSLGPTNLQIIENGGIVIDGSVIKQVVDKPNVANLVKQYPGLEIVELPSTSFLLPGFIDSHIHAPQYVFAGTGYDLPLLEWLEKYTFPRESEFKDTMYAQKAYSKVVNRTLSCGTTTACYYATIHKESSLILKQQAEVVGQRAFIGKVNMDQNSPDFYIETTKNSLQDTFEFIQSFSNSLLVRPIITPRFAPTCSSELMNGLAKLANEHNLLIQTHISENQNETSWVKKLFPQCCDYTNVYHQHGLLTRNSIMAHCIYLSDSEIELFKQNQVGISHCPNSNFSIHSGILAVRKLLNLGHLKIGLGTDCAGGYSASIMDSMRQAIIASKMLYMQSGQAPLTFKEALYLATLGNARVINQDNELGNFAVNKQFDALVVNLAAGNIDVFPHDTIQDKIEKFVYLGDDRNIEQVFVAGVQRKK